MQPIGIDERMTGGRDDLDILHTRAPQAFGDELSGALHIRRCSGSVLMLGIRMKSFSSSSRRGRFCWI